MSALNIAIAGFGTIGSGVAHVLEQHSKEPDATINLVGILESDTKGKFARPWFEKRPELFYDNPDKLLADSQVNKNRNCFMITRINFLLIHRLM